MTPVEFVTGFDDTFGSVCGLLLDGTDSNMAAFLGEVSETDGTLHGTFFIVGYKSMDFDFTAVAEKDQWVLHLTDGRKAYLRPLPEDLKKELEDAA